MQKSIIRKGLVCLVIILFIGIAVAPSVTSIKFPEDKTSNYNDLVEITLELCKPNGVEDHKMFITQEQDEQLDSLIESFKADLDNAETREETIEIYKDMVVSLDKLGILPESTSCKEVQELVTGDSYGFSKVKEFVEHKKPIFINRLAEKDKTSKETSGELENYLCLIAGASTQTTFMGPIGGIINKIQQSIINFAIRLSDDYFDIAYLIFFFATFLSLPHAISFIICTYIIPFLFGANIEYGFFGRGIPPEGAYNNAKGWIYTNGLLGTKEWDGSFRGKISEIYYWAIDGFVGATGFTGIKLFLDYEVDSYYLGSALRVKLITNPT